MGKYLGIDHGDRRIGLAISNEDKNFVFPRDNIENDKTTIIYLKDLVISEDIEKIVVGLPISLKGEDTGQTKKVRAFIEQLRNQLTIEIVEEDERFSTQAAGHLLGKINKKARKKKIDQSSAIVILQDYINKHA